MVCFDRVSKFILSDVSFCVPRGQAVGVIGSSGAGKTTLLKLAGGLLMPEQGNIRIMGREPVGARKLLGNAVGACIAGIPLLEGEDTVEEGFRMLGTIYRMPRKRYLKSYGELSERLGFEGFAGRRCSELSAGQRARVRLGAVLLPEPEVILLDEPTGGLDVHGKAALREILAERCRQGSAALVTSHDMTEISALCSRLALMEKGKLLYYGSERTLFRRYAPPEEITVKLAGAFPDLEDMPLDSYVLDGDMLKLRFHPAYITAAEVIKQLLRQTDLKSVDIHRADLEDVLLREAKCRAGTINRLETKTPRKEFTAEPKSDENSFQELREAKCRAGTLNRRRHGKFN